jgi:hypothetical protein
VKVNALASQCEALLNDFATQLTALGVTLPPMKFVWAGVVAWDGPSLSLALGGITQGQPGATVAGTFTPAIVSNFSIGLDVMLLRKVAAINYDSDDVNAVLPTPEELDASGQGLMTDAAGLLLAAVNIHAANLITDPGMGFEVVSVTPLGPDGGMAGTKLSLTVSLD